MKGSSAKKGFLEIKFPSVLHFDYFEVVLEFNEFFRNSDATCSCVNLEEYRDGMKETRKRISGLIKRISKF
ncbi:MAG: hypothetical protein ABIG28_00330 [archaeon]